MDTRTTWSKITFPKSFVLPGSDVVFAPGEYELVTEEERLQGLTFNAYRRNSAFLQVTTDPRFPGQTELRPVNEADLQQAIGYAPDPGKGATEPNSVPRQETL